MALSRGSRLESLKLSNLPSSRKELLNCPELANLAILKQAQGTNFPVTQPEAKFIDGLIERVSGRTGASQLEDVLEWVRNIRTQMSPDGRFHYKPLLLLALLNLFDRQEDHANSFSYNELLTEYRALATKLGSSIKEDQFSQPYLRL